ncbi:glycosyltransferase family 4 protein [Xenorhabdus bovienii]|uniref:Glycosyltransferase family 4 protein n=1 Tax=Xenorhabdus bovienii TaxID=40576 RepID=A0AAJ1MZ29_XENBV|nr:glycosyltransferase family 4 protein [Xenorhabdus bovienii]MDE1474601.1 glycosyltransferase family 4 protein [Xenorhabdus bovienii]MDE1478539.1 glycosyltransferase family 4 protein [Xenorhabdus bovienii]MDE9510257.1 glycosyltransferase family 4 protein [Xenorhabdus bovienii]MDE9521898.1 glycosyltransferase family 4 protein [Xenorhabdus bovienii]
MKNIPDEVIHIVPSDKNTGPVNVARDLVFGLNEIGVNSVLFNLRGNGRRNLLCSFKTLLKMIRKKNKKVLHSHGIIPDLFCCILSFFSSFRWVSTVHADPEEDLKFIYPKSYKWICLFWKKILKRASYVIYLTEYIYSKQNSNNKRVIHNSRLIKDFNTLKERPNDKITLGFCGALIERKNIRHLINVMKNMPNYLLLVAGGGPLKKELNQIVSDKNQNIKLLGHQENLQQFWESIDILILPSFAEGVPLVAIEAISKGIPLILMDLNNYRGVFTKNESVFISNLNEETLHKAIKKIQHNYDSYSKAAKVAYLERFNFKEWILSYKAIYL